MGLADMSSTGLGLGLGLSLHHHQSENCCTEIRHKKEDDPYKCDHKVLYPSLTLGLPDEQEANAQLLPPKNESVHNFQAIAASSSHSAASSFSNSSSIKRENKDFVGDDLDLEVENKVKNTSKVGLEVDDEGNPRKKLRLTKEQSAVLEDSFKEHSTLNPKQKQELARKLNLRARQVEVWFQNRRARTKLKQTEVDCELLKKCCETLTEENKRLQKELQELRSMKTMSSQGPLYMQRAAATLTLCPSCEKICGGGGATATTNGSPATTSFLIGSKAHHHLYKSNYPFTHSSAAC